MFSEQPETRPPGERMAYWLANTLQQEREKVGISETEMAQVLGVNVRTIQRLEEGDSMGRDVDMYVAGYAHALGFDDARELWQRAVTGYKRHGTPPRFIAIGEPTQAFAQAIRATAQRRRRGIAAPSQTRDATQNRRANG